ncbi:MAG: enoyl-CoA hydratase/isomerase family protein [bacterium]|nr:enoyl-CoA hydratase/isomerase family protein [bacterium]
MDAQYLTVSIEQKVALVTINRPEKRNALSPELLGEIEYIFTSLSENDDVSVVVLTGGEKYFSAGFDLNVIRTLEKVDNEEFTALFHRAYRAILYCSQPVIAAVGGPAIAGGFDLTLMCDIRYASKRAKFGQREIALSLTPILDPLWRIIGYGRAMEVALSGRVYDALEAENMGYVSKVFPEGELLEPVMEIARNMASYDKVCLKETKQLGQSVLHTDLNTSMRTQEWLFRTYIGSEENHNRIDAFLEVLKKK